jgi:hypothetical protein
MMISAAAASTSSRGVSSGRSVAMPDARCVSLIDSVGTRSPVAELRVAVVVVVVVVVVVDSVCCDGSSFVVVVVSSFVSIASSVVVDDDVDSVYIVW